MATHSLQYSCIENPMDRETWWVTVHGVAKRQTKLKQLSIQGKTDFSSEHTLPLKKLLWFFKINFLSSLDLKTNFTGWNGTYSILSLPVFTWLPPTWGRKPEALIKINRKTIPCIPSSLNPIQTRLPSESVATGWESFYLPNTPSASPLLFIC